MVMSLFSYLASIYAFTGLYSCVFILPCFKRLFEVEHKLMHVKYDLVFSSEATLSEGEHFNVSWLH